MTTLKKKISDLAFEVEGILTDLESMNETMSELQSALVNLMESDIPESHEIEEAEIRGATWVLERLMPGNSKIFRTFAKEICDSSRDNDLFRIR